jgi:small subunit ribosomal protein S17
MSDSIEKSTSEKKPVKKNIRTLIGLVISDKMSKTILVSIENRVKHRVYGKFVRRNVRLLAHDEKNISKVGDRVLIKEGPPLSRHKSWVLAEVVEKAQ